MNYHKDLELIFPIDTRPIPVLFPFHSIEKNKGSLYKRPIQTHDKIHKILDDLTVPDGKPHGEKNLVLPDVLEVVKDVEISLHVPDVSGPVKINEKKVRFDIPQKTFNNSIFPTDAEILSLIESTNAFKETYNQALRSICGGENGCVKNFQPLHSNNIGEIDEWVVNIYDISSLISEFNVRKNSLNSEAVKIFLAGVVIKNAFYLFLNHATCLLELHTTSLKNEYFKLIKNELMNESLTTILKLANNFNPPHNDKRSFLREMSRLLPMATLYTEIWGLGSLGEYKEKVGVKQCSRFFKAVALNRLKYKHMFVNRIKYNEFRERLLTRDFLNDYDMEVGSHMIGNAANELENFAIIQPLMLTHFGSTRQIQELPVSDVNNRSIQHVFTFQNLNGNHWNLWHYDGGEMKVYDSMLMGTSEEYMSFAELFKSFILYAIPHADEDIGLNVIKDNVQQTDGYNCGVFSLLYLRAILVNDDIKDNENLRTKILSYLKSIEKHSRFFDDNMEPL